MLTFFNDGDGLFSQLSVLATPTLILFADIKGYVTWREWANVNLVVTEKVLICRIYPYVTVFGHFVFVREEL